MSEPFMSPQWQRDLVQRRPRVAGMIMAAPTVLLLAGLRSHGTIGHYVRLGALAMLVLLLVALAAAIVWANTWPKEAKEKLKRFQEQKMAELPAPRVASRDPRI